MSNPEEKKKTVSLEQKFMDVQRDLRRGDSDFKMYASETQKLIIKQHTTIDILRNKNNVLKENIVV